MIKTIDLGIQWYADKLMCHEPFTIMRYGDGEWSVIIKNRTICLKQRLNLPGLRNTMIKSITQAHHDSRYLPACHPNQTMGTNIEVWLAKHQPHWLKWIDSRTFCHASLEGELFPFVNALRHLDVPLIAIGPPWHVRLSEFLPISEFIEINPRDCWNQRKYILDRVLTIGPACYTMSAGPASSPLGWLMFGLGLNTGWIIDVGSLWDVYCDNITRSYQRRLTPQLIQRNLKGR
jgi:hypothetical protein